MTKIASEELTSHINIIDRCYPQSYLILDLRYKPVIETITGMQMI